MLENNYACRQMIKNMNVFRNFRFVMLLNVCLRATLVFIVSVLQVSNLMGQNKCYTVIDSSTNETIPYCNVLINNKDGLVTNHEGQFCVSSSQEDTLMISLSNISYFSHTFLKSSHDTVSFLYLIPKSHAINAIDINWSKYKFDWLGNPIKQSDGYINLWRFCQLGIGIKPSIKRSQILESVKIPIYNNSKFKVPFRLHVYRITSDGGVGEELLPANVYGQLLQDSEIVELDILQYQITIPPNGVFVSVELLSNNKPTELMLGSKKYFEKDNNRISYTNARYRHRKMLKLSAWKPNSFYVESYPFTKVEGMVGDLPLIKVKVRSIRK
jgi:hypothetical protein